MKVVIGLLFALLILKALGLSKSLLGLDPDFGFVSLNIDLGFVSSIGLFGIVFGYIYKFQGRVTALETKLDRILKDVENISKSLP